MMRPPHACHPGDPGLRPPFAASAPRGRV